MGYEKVEAGSSAIVVLWGMVIKHVNYEQPELLFFSSVALMIRQALRNRIIRRVTRAHGSPQRSQPYNSLYCMLHCRSGMVRFHRTRPQRSAEAKGKGRSEIGGDGPGEAGWAETSSSWAGRSGGRGLFLFLLPYTPLV